MEYNCKQCISFISIQILLENSEMKYSVLSLNEHVTGFRTEPGNLKKPGDLNFICPGPEIAWNLS